MAYEFDIVGTPATTLATASAVVRMEEIPQRITVLFDVVYEWLRERGRQHGGHNHALYRPHPDGLVLQVGVPVSSPFEDADLVRCVELPALRAAPTPDITGSIPGCLVPTQRCGIGAASGRW